MDSCTPARDFMPRLQDTTGRATIILLKAHLRCAMPALRYTGRVRDANKLAHVKPIFVSFVCTHLDYMREAYGYEMRRGAREPGQKAPKRQFLSSLLHSLTALRCCRWSQIPPHPDPLLLLLLHYSCYYCGCC